MRPLGRDPEDGLREERVGPREPGARVVGDVVDVDGLVDEAQQARVAHEVERRGDLGVRVGGQGLHEEGHGPGVVQADCDGRQ